MKCGTKYYVDIIILFTFYLNVCMEYVTRNFTFEKVPFIASPPEYILSIYSSIPLPFFIQQTHVLDIALT